MKIRNRIKELRMIKASVLMPNPKNWRTHPQAQQDALKGILAEVGYADALLARELPDGSLMLVDGHLRAESTPDLEVPVLVLDITESEADKLLLSLDPLSAMAGSDALALDSLLREVNTGSQALSQMFADMAAEAGLYQGDAKEIVEDEVPEPPVDPITKPGDLWVLGEHRLLCGDSTKTENVERLTQGKKIICLITDPPYGIDWQGSNASTKKWEGIANDTGNLNLKPILKNYEIVVSFGANCYPQDLPHRGRWICWDKRVNENADKMLGSPFELAWTNLKSGFDKIYRIMHGGVVNDDGNKSKRVHPTQKPVRLMFSIIQDYSEENDVLDLFLGSGTTLIAAEQLGRKCYGMEISPAYCDVIVQRWETLTGKKAVLEESHGS